MAIAAAVATSAPAHAQMIIPKAIPLSGAQQFGQRCGACHSTVPSETRIGPSLAGVIGRRAGSLSGYDYSAALKASTFVWTKASLDRWLISTTAVVPGTKMIYAQADPAARAAIVDYLATLPRR